MPDKCHDTPLRTFCLLYSLPNHLHSHKKQLISEFCHSAIFPPSCFHPSNASQFLVILNLDLTKPHFQPFFLPANGKHRTIPSLSRDPPLSLQTEAELSASVDHAHAHSVGVQGTLGDPFPSPFSWIARLPQTLPTPLSPRRTSPSLTRRRSGLDAAVPGCGAALARRGLGGGAERGGVRGG